MAKIHEAENMTMAELSREIQRGGKLVVYKYCISLVIITMRRHSDIFYIPAGKNAAWIGIEFTLLSLIAGWCGIPFGPIFTIEAIISNMNGGKDVTQEVLGIAPRR